MCESKRERVVCQETNKQSKKKSVDLRWFVCIRACSSFSICVCVFGCALARECVNSEKERNPLRNIYLFPFCTTVLLLCTLTTAKKTLNNKKNRDHSPLSLFSITSTVSPAFRLISEFSCLS